MLIVTRATIPIVRRRNVPSPTLYHAKDAPFVVKTKFFQAKHHCLKELQWVGTYSERPETHQVHAMGPTHVPTCVLGESGTPNVQMQSIPLPGDEREAFEW